MHKAIAVWLTAGILAGCTAGPDYRRPDSPVGTAFLNEHEPGLVDGDLITRYWSGFEDELLDALVGDALAQNLDVATAVANLQAARQESRLTGFDRYPTITTSGGYTHLEQSEQKAPGLFRQQRQFDVADAEFDALWELDLFGRVRRGVEAARAEVGVSDATLSDVRVSVVAEVSRDYFVLRGLQEKRALTERNAENQRKTMALTQYRLDAGRGNKLDTSRAEAQWRTTLSSIPRLEADIAATMYRLSVMTGRTPGALVEQLSVLRSWPTQPKLVAVGSPEQLLRRRPDVRFAERRLASATARVGIAVGDLFPKATLIGSIGLSGPSLGSLGDSGSSFYAIGPSLSWPALDLGRVRARIGAANARTDAALAQYQASVLNALRDTESALIIYGRSQVESGELEMAAAASENAAELARQRFRGGLVDFLEVLDAERTALSAGLLFSESRTAEATALVAVYKSLGAGSSDPGLDEGAKDR